MFQKRIKFDNSTAERLRKRLPDLIVKLSNLVSRTIGCWHSDMSRPFTINNETYRVCLDCGARRQFLPEHWETTGYFYRQAPPPFHSPVLDCEDSNQNHEEPAPSFSATRLV